MLLQQGCPARCWALQIMHLHTGAACSLHLLPVVSCLRSPALASACSFSRAEAAPQTTSAALPDMWLQAASEFDGCMLALSGSSVAVLFIWPFQ